MATAILVTKLYIPPPRPKVVSRSRLIEQLNKSLHGKLTLISAAAGFGKTTLVSEWVAGCGRPVAWLSLDEGDNDPARFLTYLVAALQTIAANIGAGVLGVLQSPQPPPTEAILTTLLNEISAIPNSFIFILDDYHLIDAKPVDHALTFLIDHLPPQMHLVIATREDPQLPLARLRARGQLTELRATDLRFTPAEAAGFLNQVMGLTLSAEEIGALETHTEGWIAGLQLAALALQGLALQGTLSMQGHQDVSSFIKSFTGSHRFILDYLVEEVLQQQTDSIQTFLLRTSILDRMCGPLCDAVLHSPAASGQATLETIEHANLFIIPLDNERRWYRYHHLFGELLRQRLHQSIASPTGAKETNVTEYHIRASQWYEDNGLDIEAFHHAAAANDVERVERLIEGNGIPLHLRGAVTAILNWLASLPIAILDARPSLWYRYASVLLIIGHTTGVEDKLQAAEAAMQDTPLSAEQNDQTRNLIGQIAVARATLALTRYQIDAMLAQSLRALAFLHPTKLSARASAYWTMGYAYILQGDRAAAHQAMTDSIALSQASGAIFTTILATIGLGNVQESNNHLHLAVETYRRILQLAGDQPLQIIAEAHLGLARVLYEWNDLDAAEQHGRQSLQLARQYESVIDRFIICEVFLARLQLAQGDVNSAVVTLTQASQSASQPHFAHRMPEVAAVQIQALLRQGDLVAAAHLADIYTLPISQARVHLAQGNPSTALAVLEPLRQQVEAKRWADEQLKVMVLQAITLDAHGEVDKAVHLLGEALTLAEPGGFIRIFADEGLPMARLLSKAAARGVRPSYTGKLLAAFDPETQTGAAKPLPPTAQVLTEPLVEPLSQRELEVLKLIAQGLSNHAISARLFLALDTVKGHNRRIYDKLQVQRRTEAVARARELGLL